MFYIGCHLSASDGFLAMGKTALSIGANTFQFFTRNPRGSKAKAIGTIFYYLWHTICTYSQKRYLARRQVRWQEPIVSYSKKN